MATQIDGRLSVPAFVDESEFDEMGKRKAKRKAPPKKRFIEKLDTQFNCPFCNHERSCEVKM